MSGIERRDPQPRPEWVDEMIKSIDTIVADITSITNETDAITRAVSIRKLENVTNMLMQASHDLNHAEDHLVSVRRSLRMSWPEGEQEDG